MTGADYMDSYEYVAIEWGLVDGPPDDIDPEVLYWVRRAGWTASRVLAVVEGRADSFADEYANGCGVCGCCPCGVPDCPDCPTAAPDTGPYGYDVPMVHGGKAPPIVAGDIARERSRHPTTKAIREVKRGAHRRHRRAWRQFCHGARLGADNEPTLKPGSAWEVW